MPVRKMRDIAEAETPVAPPLLSENLRSAFELSEVCLRLHPIKRHHGVKRYRSIDEAEFDIGKP